MVYKHCIIETSPKPCKKTECCDHNFTDEKNEAYRGYAICLRETSRQFQGTFMVLFKRRDK